MENKNEILEKIEKKLIQNLENIKTKSKQVIDCQIQLKDLINQKQTIEKLYEKQVEKCEQLNENLIKSKFETKVAIEKEVLQLKEEKSLNLAQINRLNSQLNVFKNDLNCSESVRLSLEKQLSDISNDYEMKNSLKTSISSQIMEINSKIESVVKYLSTIESVHNELNNSVKMAIESNLELKLVTKEQNQYLLIAENEISSLRQQLVELSSKSLNTENLTNDKDLQISQLHKQNDLQKQEIIRLKLLLQESRNEKKWLINLLTETNVDPLSICANNSENQILPENAEENN